MKLSRNGSKQRGEITPGLSWIRTGDMQIASQALEVDRITKITMDRDYVSGVYIQV